MPRVIEKTVYKFDELPEGAKGKARDWLRQFVFSDSNDWDSVYEDAEAIAKILGIELDRRTRGHGPAIWFSGFSSQGDGACFEGRYSYKPGAVRAIKAYAPKDERLHGIAQRLVDVQKTARYRLTARMKQSGHYYHSGCMDVDVERSDDREASGDTLTRIMRDFADWIYRQLEAEHDYQVSDESIDERLTCNEYEFYESGKRACV